MGIFDSPVNRGIGYGLPGGVPAQPSAYGILGQQAGWGPQLGLLGAALADAGASLSGRPQDAGRLQEYGAQLRNRQVQQQLIAGLTSNDPATRQQAYTQAALLGIPTDAIQKQQAASQLPALLQSMRPSQQTLNSTSAPLPGGGTVTSAPIGFEAPGQSMSEAIASAPPEIASQFAPKLLDLQMQAEADANKPYDLSPGQTRFRGGQPVASLPEKNNPNQPFNVDGTPNLAFQKYTKDLKAYEASVSPMNTNNNPFGKGMTGHAYAILAAGAKDPKVRDTPEYLTAWQILSNPHVDPNTGTIVVPDLSAYQPPTGVAANGAPGQQRMPSIQAFAPPNPSQADAASAGYANRLAESTAQIDQNEGALTSLGQNLASKTPVVGNYLVSPQFQQGDQAERNFINAQLRRESGAAIAESEFANARKQYIPQPGDSKAVLDQKRAARATAVRNMQLSAGNTLLPPGVIQNASPPRGAPIVPMEQGFGLSASPQNLPRIRDGAVPPAPQRTIGQTYQTPRGPLKWNGNGWLAP